MKGEADMSNNEEILQMIEDCERRDERMSEWEQKFIDSLSHQLTKGRALSTKQEEILTRIWENVT